VLDGAVRGRSAHRFERRGQAVKESRLRLLLAAQEVERRRLARELHDETGQALTSILLGLHALEDTLERDESRVALEHVRVLVANTLQDVRRLAVELRPKALDDFGLVVAIERLTESWSAATAIAVDFTASVDDGLFSNELATALYRIVQESLTNVVKHAHASHVSILLTRKDESVVAVIEDDGDGFDAAKAAGDGITGMRERVALLGGRFQIESTRGAGTALVVELPLS
jgi:signal transduction histidine kinase